MFILKLRLLLAGLALISLPAISDIYQWTDAEGNVHFGDDPPSDVDIKLLNIETTAQAPTPSSSEIDETEISNINKIVSQENDRIIE